MTDRLQQKAREICLEFKCSHYVPGDDGYGGEDEPDESALKAVTHALTAGIAMAAERCEERAQRSNNARGGMGQIFADTQDREARECAVAIRALAKGETQHG